jgi:hypothetical protein
MGTPKALAGRAIFFAMPFYGLAKARDGSENAPTVEDMHELMGAWLSGKDPPGRPAPRGVRTMREACAALSQMSCSGLWSVIPGCTLLAVARSVQATQFLATHCEAMICIDDDIYTEPSTIVDLVEAGGDIVFATYRERLGHHRVILHTLDDGDPRLAPTRRLESGRRVLELKTGPMGCCLIRRHVIERVIEAHPELTFEDSDGSRHTCIFNQSLVLEDRGGRQVPRAVGEDIAFMFRARAVGFKVECVADCTVDHDGIACNLGELLDSDLPFKPPETEPAVALQRHATVKETQ